MADLNGIPVYKIKINESIDNREGIDFVSLVDFPAIETNWVALSKTDKKVPYKFGFNTDQKLLYGPILIPDMPIYRFDASMGEYYVVFTKDEIQKLVRKFQKQQKTVNLNYQHKPDSQIDGVIQEIWLTGKSDKSKDFGFDLPEGSGFAVSYIEDDKFWNEQVKTGNVKGYSIEGWLDMEITAALSKRQILADYPGGWDQCVIDMTKTYGDKATAEKVCGAIKAGTVQHKKQNKMNNEKFIEAKTSDGATVIKTDATAWSAGIDVYTTDTTGAKATLPDGDYTMENGDVFKVVGGKLTEIVSTDATMTQEEEVAMKKVFSKVFANEFKEMNDKIAALEAKLASIPGAPAKTSKNDTDQNAKKPTHAQVVMSKINRIKELNKTK